LLKESTVHEVSLVQSLFDQLDHAIAPHACGPGGVRRVTVRIGALAGVERDLFRTAYEGCRSDRGFRSAELEIVEEPTQWTCTVCTTHEVSEDALRCAHCDGEVELSAGGGIYLDRVEMEVADV
jgi:hydrogenase nickel incorporation protein HypA/HybF